MFPSQTNSRAWTHGLTRREHIRRELVSLLGVQAGVVLILAACGNLTVSSFSVLLAVDFLLLILTFLRSARQWDAHNLVVSATRLDRDLRA